MFRSVSNTSNLNQDQEEQNKQDHVLLDKLNQLLSSLFPTSFDASIDPCKIKLQSINDSLINLIDSKKDTSPITNTIQPIPNDHTTDIQQLLDRMKNDTRISIIIFI